MRAALIWLLTLVSLAAAVFFWLRQADLQARLDGLAIAAASHDRAIQPDLVRLRDMEGLVDTLDRALARGLNGQDSLVRDVARLGGAVDPAVRASIEARLARLKSDLEGPARTVRALLLAIDPPDFTLDPDSISDAANAAFLAKIDADPAFAKTESGLRYRRLAAVVSGVQPTPDSDVTVHYRGSFIEGTEFDSSYGRGEAATFPLGQLIAGWVEGIPLMKQGETFEFVLPYELAYGAAGRGSIPPRQTLVFQVELLKVETVPSDRGAQ